MKIKLNAKRKKSGNLLIIGGALVVLPLAGIGLGLLLHYLFFTTVIVPDPPPAPMIDWEDSPLLEPACDCGGNCEVP